MGCVAEAFAGIFSLLLWKVTTSETAPVHPPAWLPVKDQDKVGTLLQNHYRATAKFLNAAKRRSWYTASKPALFSFAYEGSQFLIMYRLWCRCISFYYFVRGTGKTNGPHTDTGRYGEFCTSMGKRYKTIGDILRVGSCMGLVKLALIL